MSAHISGTIDFCGLSMLSGSIAAPVVLFKEADYACNIAEAGALKRDLLPLANG